MNGALKSKTMWFAALTALTGVVQQLSPFIPEGTTGKIMMGLGVVTAALRMVTSQSLAEKGNDGPQSGG